MGILNGIQERNTIKMVQTQTLGKLKKPSVFCIVYKILCQSLRLDSNQRPLRPELSVLLNYSWTRPIYLKYTLFFPDIRSFFPLLHIPLHFVGILLTI